jgi:cysteine synthase
MCLSQCRISDSEAIAMSRYIAAYDGLFLGSSSAFNLVACVHLAKKLKKDKDDVKIVTILCDSGTRHYSKVGVIFSSMRFAGVTNTICVVLE